MATQPKPLAVAPAVESTTQAASLLDKILEQQASVATRYKPVMSIDEMLEREKALDYLVTHIMREGIDYGWVPGTKPKEQPKPGEYQAKPTLFKAGAERACAFFGYAPSFERERVIEEWTPEKYGEMLFYYEFRCTLSKDGAPIGQGLGSGSTWESKYRYRNADRVCPSCGAAAIIKGKAEYGGGWLCFGKKGGCGAKFADLDPAIAEQATGKVPNADIADMINTVSKMAQKRAYVAATLTATGLSGRFTQDMEDMPAAPAQEPVTPRASTQGAKQAAPAAQEPAREQSPAEREFREADRYKRLHLFGVAKQALGDVCGSVEAGEARYYEHIRAEGVEKCSEFKSLASGLRAYLAMLADIDRLKAAATPADASAEYQAQDSDLPF